MLFDVRPKSTRKELYGRDLELDRLIKTLSSGPPLVILLGIRRIGKTSLLKTALHQIQIPSIYVDMRRLEEEGYSKVVLYRILSEQMNKLSSVHTKITDALKHVKGVQIVGNAIELDWSAKGTLLSSVFDSLDQMMEKRKTSLVVAVDEAQLLKNMVGGKGKIDFRSLIAYAYDNLPNIKFLLTGSEIGLLMDFIGVENPKSALYGRGREEIILERFSREKSFDFLEKGFAEIKVKMNSDDLRKAVEALDGIVGWLTLYGSLATSSSKDRTQRNHLLEKVLENAKEAIKAELDPILARSRYYRLVLISLSREKAHWIKVKRDLSSWIGRPISDAQVTNALRTLCQLSILENVNGEYSICDPIIKEFAKSL